MVMFFGLGSMQNPATLLCISSHSPVDPGRDNTFCNEGQESRRDSWPCLVQNPATQLGCQHKPVSQSKSEKRGFRVKMHVLTLQIIISYTHCS